MRRFTAENAEGRGELQQTCYPTLPPIDLPGWGGNRPSVVLRGPPRLLRVLRGEWRRGGSAAGQAADDEEGLGHARRHGSEGTSRAVRVNAGSARESQGGAAQPGRRLVLAIPALASVTWRWRDGSAWRQISATNR